MEGGDKMNRRGNEVRITWQHDGLEWHLHVLLLDWFLLLSTQLCSLFSFLLYVRTLWSCVHVEMCVCVCVCVVYV